MTDQNVLEIKSLLQGRAPQEVLLAFITISTEDFSSSLCTTAGDGGSVTCWMQSCQGELVLKEGR